MSAVPVSNFQSISALFNLEIRSINGEMISKENLIDAIKSDVANHLPISKTAIFKHFTGNKILAKADLEQIVHTLQNGVAESMAVSHDAALSYAHAAIICASELSRA